MRGLIALDIDGTLTNERYHLDGELNSFLNSLIASGWRLVFLTGRTYAYALPVLSKLRGDYFLSVQNGAATYAMPDNKLLDKEYIAIDLLPQIGSNSLLIQSGLENQDTCYYIPEAFGKEQLDYIQLRIKISPEPWVAIHSFDELRVEEFASGKFFGPKNEAEALANRINQIETFRAVVIHDPRHHGSYMTQVNAYAVCKGRALKKFLKNNKILSPIIVAGDDQNDRGMLELADIKIVMKNAPEELLEMANYITEPSKGLITVLKEAIWTG